LPARKKKEMDRKKSTPEKFIGNLRIAKIFLSHSSIFGKVFRLPGIPK